MGSTLDRRRFSALTILTLVSAFGCSDATQLTRESQLVAPTAALASLTSGTGVSSPITNRLPGSPCMDVANESRAAGTQVQIWNCYGSSAQTFSWMADGTIRAYASTTPMCLTAMGTGQDGDRIQIQSCGGSVHQKWTATAAGEIRGLNGKCLDVYDAKPTNGTRLILWSCHGGSNQKWDNSTGSGTTPPSVAPSPTVASVVVTLAASSLQVGQTTQATAVARDASGAAISGAGIAWSSSNMAVATVSTSGLVTAVATGSASITATISGTTGSQGLSVSSPPTPAGIAILPGESIQAKVDANPAGTTFILKAGTHVRQSVVPKDGNVFRGEPGTVLDGQNATSFAFKGHNGARWVNNVTVRNLAITKYAPPAQNGAIWGGDDIANGTTGWVLDSLDVSHNANIGVRIGNRMKVLRSTIHHNGTVNIGGVGRAVLVDGVVSTYGNNGCSNNPGFESGGSKFVMTDSLIVRNSTFSDNCGVGLWLDIKNVNYQLHNNTVANNVREGICIEVSFGGKVFDNTVTANGWPTDPYRPNGWAWDAGIGIHASPDVEVYGNTLNENFQGIVAIQQPRDVAHGDSYAPSGGFLVQNLYVHDNIVYQRTFGGPNGGDGSIGGGAVTDAGDNAVFMSRNNRWVRNTYYLGSNTRPFAWMNGYRTAAEWRAYGQDTAGSFNP